MTGLLRVDQIIDTATTGSPTFPNGLDVSNLVDPVGGEGDVLTVQADGSIAAAAGGGSGAGIPIALTGLTDRADADEVGAALQAALPLLQTPASGLWWRCSVSDAAGGVDWFMLRDSGAFTFAIEDVFIGSGDLYVWCVALEEV